MVVSDAQYIQVGVWIGSRNDAGALLLACQEIQTRQMTGNPARTYDGMHCLLIPFKLPHTVSYRVVADHTLPKFG